jgi:hypothetical protein
MANAASSQTYFIGFPSWLPIGAGSTLPSDPNAISAAIIAAKDRNPLIGWGTGGVNLQPVWVNWLAGASYTLPVESAIAKEGTKITTAISSAGGKHRAAPSATRKTPVKDAVKKATGDIKKAVTKVSDNVKKALGGGKAGAA